MKHLVLLLLLSFSTPIFAENATSWAPWIPAGWSLISSATGDLNKDEKIRGQVFRFSILLKN